MDQQSVGQGAASASHRSLLRPAGWHTPAGTPGGAHKQNLRELEVVCGFRFCGVIAI